MRVHGAQPLPGRVRLPALEDVAPAEDGLLDQVGRAVADQRLLVAGGALAGGVLGMTMGGGGMLVRAARGAGAAIGAAIGAVALGALAGRVAGTSSPTTQAHVAPDAQPLRPPPAGGAPEQLRVMNWNIRELIGDDGHVRTDDDALRAVVQTVQRERPDVLVLQEVGAGSPLGGYADNLAELAAALGATDAVLVPNVVRATGKEKGGAILTFGETRIQDVRGLRHPDQLGNDTATRISRSLAWLEQVPFVDLDLPEGADRSYFPRTTSDAMITTPAGRAVRLLGVHLSGTGGERTTGGTPGSTAAMDHQLRPLVATLDAWDGATILAGDFNVRSGTPFGDYEAAMLGGAGLQDAFNAVGIPVEDRTARGSFQGSSSDVPIDRLYASKHAQVREARVLRDELARSGSDHLPIVADLVLR